MTNMFPTFYWGFSGGSNGKESTCNAGDLGSIPGFDAWRRGWQPTLVYLPGEFPRTEEPGGLGPQGRKELDMTEMTEHA